MVRGSKALRLEARFRSVPRPVSAEPRGVDHKSGANWKDNPKSVHIFAGFFKPQTLRGTAIYAYIDPQNHPNVGIYGIHGVSGNRIGGFFPEKLSTQLSPSCFSSWSHDWWSSLHSHAAARCPPWERWKSFCPSPISCPPPRWHGPPEALEPSMIVRWSMKKRALRTSIKHGGRWSIDRKPHSFFLG